MAALHAAGERIGLVKSTTNADVAVLWQAIEPTQNTTVSWDESVFVYESTTALQANAVLQIGSSANATPGNTYTIAAGQFDGGTSGLSPPDIGIRDGDMTLTINGIPMMTGGLSQAASVNGQNTQSPVDAQAILFGQLAVTATSEQLLVFAIGGGTPSGSVLDRRWINAADMLIVAADAVYGTVLGPALPVDFTTVTARTIHYEDATNTFAMGALTATQ